MQEITNGYTSIEILNKLKCAFKDFVFYPSDHHYECKGKRVGISVTRLIEEYSNPFDQQAIAEKVALRDNKSVSEVLKEWEYKNKFACEKGSTCHEYAQSIWSGEEYNELLFDGSIEYLTAVNKIQSQAMNFWKDFKDKFTHIQDEQLVGSEEYNICSAVDHLFLDKNGNVWLIDYKTNSILKGYNDDEKNRRYTKKMLIPLQNIKDDSLNHYYLQLSIYKYLIEKYTNIKIYKTMIVYMSENIENYELIETPYLMEEVEKILKLRRANKMAKMILVMGEPASGKTVSLRNIPKNELYYIDCDKKGLNYKGWKNDFNEENKNYFKTNDGELIAKCMQGISEKREDIHYIVIDTINSIMIADEMRRSKDKNFDKWIDLASCIFNLVNIVPDLRDDITVIFIGHTQTDDEGFTRLLTNGKKLNKIGLEKYFDTVLIAKNNDGKYVFETKSPNSTARTPMGSYDDEQYIDNDLYEVIKVLKEY